MSDPKHTCPRCGRTMLVFRAQLGPRAGTPYWGCTDPSCNGARPYDAQTGARVAAEG